MDFINNLNIKRFHEVKIRESMPGTVEALGWSNMELQQLRFEVLSGIADLTNTTVLDLGCGHGDLKVFLDQKFSGISYKGLDQMEPFLDVAIERFKEDPNAKFYLGDFFTAGFPPADYILASGALSYVNSDPDFIFNMISKIFASCGKGFGFNLLNSTPDRQTILTGYDQAKISDFCKKIAGNIILKSDYLFNDFTIFMYK